MNSFLVVDCKYSEKCMHVYFDSSALMCCKLTVFFLACMLKYIILLKHP